MSATIRDLSERREFTASEIGLLRSRYPSVVANDRLGIAGAASYDHENVMMRGATGVLLHGMAIVRAEGVENTTACPRCIAMIGAAEGIAAPASSHERARFQAYELVMTLLDVNCEDEGFRPDRPLAEVSDAILRLALGHEFVARSQTVKRGIQRIEGQLTYERRTVTMAVRA